MKTESVKVCAALAALVVLAAAQDLAPVMFWTKPPLLLVFACIAGIPVAIAAGLFADALGAMPFGCSAALFVAAALAARHVRPYAFLVTVASAAAYQLWIVMWGGNIPVHSAYIAAAYAVILYPAAQKLFRSLKLHVGISAPGKEDLK